MSDFKKYLPSKKFTAIVLLIVVVVVLFFTIRSVAKYFHNKKIAKGAPTPVAVTVGSLTQKDSNDNGIPDWEEYLWGLNPNRNGEKNKEIILEKKKLLSKNGIISIENSNIKTNNDALSRQFFASILALQQNGELNEDSLQSLASAVGENVSIAEINDTYTKDMLIIDDSVTLKKYNSIFMGIIKKYKDKDVGKELTIIAQGIANNDKQAFYALQDISKSYRIMGSEIVKIPVPYQISDIQLSIANNCNKIGTIINDMGQSTEDPMIGINSLLGYKKYSDDLATNIEELLSILNN